MRLKPLMARLKADILLKKLATDGGPGSGNWGHAGRPGLVGGSAKGQGAGGGKQYRGGRSDIGFFNSRKDWLNGLSGEKQHTATKLLKGAREKIPPTSEMTPEEYIMKNSPIEAKRLLIELAGEARSWKDRGVHLQLEKLDNDEMYGLWQLGASLDKKYADPGETIFTDEEIRHGNFDEKWGLMTPEEQEFYLDVKAKACGLPTSGKKLTDYSKPFQKEIGVLEEASPPMTDEENRKWGEFLTRAERDEMSKGLLETFGPDKDLEELSNMNAVETVIIHGMGNASLKGDASKEIEKVAEYLRNKDSLVNAKFSESVLKSFNSVNNGAGRLDEFEAMEVCKILKHWAEEKAPDKSIENDYDEIEEGFLADKDMPENVRMAYLRLKAVALGTSRNGINAYSAKQLLRNKSHLMSEEKRLKEKAKRDKVALEEYGKTKKDHVVVIQGDSFSEKINSMRNESGIYTQEEYRKIGESVADELQKALSKADQEVIEANNKINEINAMRDEEAKKIRERGGGYSLSEIFELEAKFNEMKKPYYTRLRELRSGKPVLDLLKRVRQIGPADPKVLKQHLEGRSKAKPFLEQAYMDYPREWVERSVAAGGIFVKKVGRGYCSWGGEIGIDDGGYETGTHELGHRFEHTVPGIVEREREFFESRTKNDQWEKLRVVTGNKAYKTDEETKKDNFVNPYIGRNNGGDSYEVVSMGFQYAIHDPRRLMRDPEYAHLILGILTVG